MLTGLYTSSDEGSCSFLIPECLCCRSILAWLTHLMQVWIMLPCLQTSLVPTVFVSSRLCSLMLFVTLPECSTYSLRSYWKGPKEFRMCYRRLKHINVLLYPQFIFDGVGVACLRLRYIPAILSRHFRHFNDCRSFTLLRMCWFIESVVSRHRRWS